MKVCPLWFFIVWVFVLWLTLAPFNLLLLFVRSHERTSLRSAEWVDQSLENQLQREHAKGRQQVLCALQTRWLVRCSAALDLDAFDSGMSLVGHHKSSIRHVVFVFELLISGLVYACKCDYL